MPVGSTSQPSVQELGFASIGLLTPPCRLYPLPVRHASALPTASFRFRLATDTLAVQLTLPLAGCVEDFHLPVSAPCRAQSGRRRDYSRRPPTPPDVRFRIRRFMKPTRSAAGYPAAKPTPCGRTKTSDICRILESLPQPLNDKLPYLLGF